MNKALKEQQRQLRIERLAELEKETEKLRTLLGLTATPATASEQGVEWKQKIADFVLTILHGDGEHQSWLREAGEAFILGKPMPPPRQKSFCCAVCKRDANEAGQLLRVSRKGETTPVIWICKEHFNYEDWKFVDDNNERLERRALSQRPTPATAGKVKEAAERLLVEVRVHRAAMFEGEDDRFVNDIETVAKFVAATPSGGGEWTVKRLEQIWLAYGCKHMTDMPTFMQAVVNEINQSLQPRDCGDVEKESYIRGWYDHSKGVNAYAEPTNAAMKSQTGKRKE